MATVYDYPSSVIGNAPKTNVGIVPYAHEGQFLGVYAPRDPRIKDYLGYSAYDKIQGIPQLGISDQLVPKQIEYNRPEELEFSRDPNEPMPGVYNTELNPYDPSSKFFPYDPDFSGIMGISAYEQEKPVSQKKLIDPETLKPYAHEGQFLGVYAPRDPRIKDYLGYSPYDKIQGVPQLGIPDYLRSKQIEYNRPEELEFARDPNAPVPGGVYNTELNPYNPSSKFFPYDPDFSGIMGISAYEQEKPVSQKRLIDPETLKPYYGEYDEWYQNISVDPLKHALKKDDKGVPQLELNPKQDPEEQRDTLFHEGKHFFIDKFGKLIPKTGALSDEDQHAIIYFADMWRKNPNYAGNPNMVLTKKQAEAFMEMHNLGKKWSQFKNKFTGGKESLDETWDRLVSDRPKIKGKDTVTLAQAVAQFKAYIDPKRGDVQTPTMTQQQMVDEAIKTGGTVNPHEVTKAVYTPPTPTVHSGESSWQPTPSVAPKPPPRDYKAHIKAGAYGLEEGGPVRLRGGGIVGLDIPASKPSLFQQLFDYGRNVASMQLGGGVTGAGTGKSDSIPAMLSDGEFIMTSKAVKGMGGGNREKGFKKLNTMMKSAEGRAV